MASPRMGPDPASTNRGELETDRLHLTVPRPDDASALYALVGGEHRDEICSTLIWDGPDDVSEVEEWIDEARTQPYEEGGFRWVIRDRDGSIGADAGRAIGSIGITPREAAGRADVGYWLGRPHWGSGLMAEALLGLLDHWFTALDGNKIEADVFTHNVRGRRLVEKVGMREEGRIRHAHHKRGEWVDHFVYGILAEEWHAA